MKAFLRLFSLYVLVMLIVLPLRAQAQNTTGIRQSQKHIDSSYMANPKYDFMVQQAMKYMSDHFQFKLFRSYYMQTRQYEPIGDDIIDKMTELSYAYQTGEDPEKRKRALKEYQGLVTQHMGNIRVVVQALSLSQLDRKFGNPQFFVWMRNGLIRDVMYSGDGKTLSTAYRVITLSEETVLLGQLGVRVLESQSASEANVYYNMHTVEDIGTGQVRTVFVDTTYPMRFLKTRQAQTGQSLDINALPQ